MRHTYNLCSTVTFTRLPLSGTIHKVYTPPKMSALYRRKRPYGFIHETRIQWIHNSWHRVMNGYEASTQVKTIDHNSLKGTDKRFCVWSWSQIFMNCWDGHWEVDLCFVVFFFDLSREDKSPSSWPELRRAKTYVEWHVTNTTKVAKSKDGMNKGLLGQCQLALFVRHI